MDTSTVCTVCGLRQKPSRSPHKSLTLRFFPRACAVTSPRQSAMTLKKFQTRVWCYVFSLILVSTSVWGAQRFVLEPDNVSVSQGLVVVLNCTMTEREGLVQWTQNGVALGTDRALPGYPRYSMIGMESRNGDRVVSGEWNLQIMDVRLEDDGEYQCQAGATSQARGIRSRVAVVTVVIPPEPPTIDGAPTIGIVLYRPTNLTCRANNGRPAADITWYLDGQRVTQQVYSRSYPRPEEKFVDTVALITINASKSDSGRRVECRAYNHFMPAPYVTFATLDVQYAPEITMVVNVTHIREYDFVSFTCNGFGNPADITWRWYRNNRQLEGEAGGRLVIQQISYDYNGDTMACTALNRVGQTRRETTLAVEYGPRIVNIEPVVGADLLGSVDLQCTADGNPAPHLIWTRKDRGSPTMPQTLSTSSTYHIDTVSRASFGVYVCTAVSTGFPDASKEVLLLQNGAPSIRSELRQFAELGEQGKLECVAHSVPKPDRMVWLKDGQPIDYASSGRFSSEEKDLLYGRTNILHILNVQKEDFGNYNCNVVNAIGVANATLTLVEKTVPPLPYIIGGVVGGVAVIFIIALACVLYTRYRRGDVDSVLGSTTDTDSSAADKKRKDADSPSTLMDQWRQDYNKPKDFYRYSADYDELNYKDHTGNNNAYGCLEPSEQQYNSSTFVGGELSRTMTPLERYEAVYGPAGYSMSSFRGRERTGLDMSNAKLATDV